MLGLILYINDDGTGRGMVVKSTGNVGIGTTGPGQNYLLHLAQVGIDQNYAYGDVTYPTYAGIIPRLSTNASLVANSLQNMYFNIDSDNDAADAYAFIFAKNANGNGGTEIMRIQESGNVGIGTTGPGAKLDVNGNIYISAASNPVLKFTGADGSMIQTNATTLYFDIDADNNGTGGFWSWRNNAATEVMNLSEGGNLQLDGMLSVDGTGNSYISGNVGIGTTGPGAKLEVVGLAGSTTLRNRYAAGSDNYIDINYNTINSVGGNNLKLYDAGSGIDVKNGNVGIGTTSLGRSYKINTGTDGTIGQIVRANSGQTANLQEWQTSDGAMKAAIGGSGLLPIESWRWCRTN